MFFNFLMFNELIIYQDIFMVYCDHLASWQGNVLVIVVVIFDNYTSQQTCLCTADSIIYVLYTNFVLLLNKL